MILKIFKVLVLLIFVFSLPITAQKFKEKNEINLDKEGEVGKLLLKANNAATTDSSKIYAHKALKLYKTEKDSSLYPYIYSRLGHFHYVQNHTDSAQYFFNKAIKLYPKDAKSDLLAYNLSYMGGIACYDEDYDLAIKYYKNTIETATSESVKIRIKLNCANLYIETYQEELAKEFIDDVLNYYKKNTEEGLNHIHLIYAYSNLAKLESKLEKKLAYVNKMISIVNENSFSNEAEKARIILQGLSLRGGIYLFAKPPHYSEAISDFKNCIKLAKKHSFEKSKTQSYLQLSTAYHHLGDFKKSVAYADSVKTSNSNSWTNRAIDTLRFHGFYHSKKLDSVYYYANKTIKRLNNDLKELETNGYIEYGKKYQTEKKIQENELLKKEGIIKDLRAKNDAKDKYLIIALVVMKLLFLYKIYSRNKKNKKIVKVLANKNRGISVQNKELELANQNKQRIFSIISHDLINPFNTVLGFSAILEEDFDNLSKNKQKEYVKIIKDSSQTNYKLTKSLLDWARLQEGLITANKTSVKLKAHFIESIGPLASIAKEKQIQITVDVQDDLTIITDKNLLNTILNNLVSNAIKFTPEKGSIDISASINSQNCILAIRDTGVGIAEEKLQRIREKNHVSTKGTNNETGSGFGLLLCDELVTLLGGVLLMESEINKGTTVAITLPYG